VNKKYICYGLKAGQIRVINLFTAGRALMRGHEAPLCDLKFFGEDVDLLGSTAKDGRVFVRRVVESQGADASDITDVPLLSLRLTDDDAQPAAAAPHFGWHASDPNVFAVAAARTVLLCNLETLAAQVGSQKLSGSREHGRGVCRHGHVPHQYWPCKLTRLQCASSSQAGDASTPLAVNLSSPPAGAVVLAGHTGDVHTVCFSPDGSLLASGGEDGSVRIWDVANGACMSSVDAHEGQPVCSVMWAPDAAQPVGASLLTGGELNTQVREQRRGAPQTPIRIRLLPSSSFSSGG
jgi:enhancer of mRNA-decapping protein 4